ncbi:MarR family winged helix-turn-helix transcriptional regulator [Alkalibacterium sp. MB6]|uniref:MarR family winged helix-turn-helix transcriptional regulator n=1 Tax=Alkalibacterium sp. MB6 TaxID=2081965 RepID=UPI00235181B5|nr:MarR family transcriptional regulator [Alkalibacterium sp. MB6]
MSKDSLKLENQLCFPLYAVTRQLTKIYRPLLSQFNLTYPQYLVLLALYEHQNLTVKALGERLFLDSGTLTPMLKRMEENGLVERIRSKSDERVVEVTLTEKGKNLEDRIESVPVDFMKEVKLEESEYFELKRILAKIMNQV